MSTTSALTPSLASETVELGLAVELRYVPLGLDPAALLHAVERRVQGAILDA